MNTNDSIITKTNRAKKMMLWFGMISMSMTFAGLTSAYVVSSSRADWIQQIQTLQVMIEWQHREQLDRKPFEEK